MRNSRLWLVWLLVGLPNPVFGQSPAAPCEGLTRLGLPNTTVTLARTVEAGAFTPPTAAAGEAPAAPVPNLPAFCRVAATLAPSSDSDITIEVWMPAANWNGKFQAVGNGAFNGTIPYGAMMAALRRGYATGGTDTGHAGGGARWAVGHPEKVIDFGWRAVHEMTVASKKIVAAYYAAGPRYSYWNGCSAGGRQAMKAAQRFPEDFNGIIAGAPGLDWTGRAAQATRVAILKKKAEIERVRLPDDVAYLIASRIKANIREIEGSLTRMIAFCSLSGREMSVELAQEVLSDLWGEEEKIITIEHIQRKAAEFFGIKLSDMRAKNRTKAVAFPRQIAMFLARQLTHASLTEVGRTFGGKDHTTVLHAVEKIQTMVQEDPKFKKTVDTLTQSITL